MSFGFVVERVSLTDLESARRSAAFGRMRAAILLAGVAALPGCEVVYQPACQTDCQAAGGNDSFARDSETPPEIYNFE